MPTQQDVLRLIQALVTQNQQALQGAMNSVNQSGPIAGALIGMGGRITPNVVGRTLTLGVPPGFTPTARVLPQQQLALPSVDEHQELITQIMKMLANPPNHSPNLPPRYNTFNSPGLMFLLEENPDTLSSFYGSGGQDVLPFAKQRMPRAGTKPREIVTRTAKNRYGSKSQSTQKRAINRGN
ncbi:MAG: hypothetical protein KGL39_12930 [Patescibacteria group bacterium]|nr:hypothetical protein [Patescibacteria group bacterium]